MFCQLNIMQSLAPILEVSVTAREEGIHSRIPWRELFRNLQFVYSLVVTALGKKNVAHPQVKGSVVWSERQSRPISNSGFRQQTLPSIIRCLNHVQNL